MVNAQSRLRHTKSFIYWKIWGAAIKKAIMEQMARDSKTPSSISSSKKKTSFSFSSLAAEVPS